MDNIEEIVTQGYRNILNREPDPVGFQDFVGAISSGIITKERFLETLRTSEEHKNKIGRPTLSVCSFMMNERYVVRDMLECIKNICPEEIIVIDEYSTDGTREILKEYNAIIIDGKLEDNYSNIRNIAISNTTKDWILFIDADETLERSLCDTLKTRELLIYCEQNKYDIVALSRKNYVDNILLSGTRFYPDHQCRILKNNGKIKYVGNVHEAPTGFTNMLWSGYHIIHKKTKERQELQHKRYKEMYKKYNINDIWSF